LHLTHKIGQMATSFFGVCIRVSKTGSKGRIILAKGLDVTIHYSLVFLVRRGFVRGFEAWYEALFASVLFDFALKKR
jgi:hypothetical protein